MNNSEENTSSFSEEDINSILEDNGIQNIPPESTEQSESSVPSGNTASSTPSEENKIPLNSPTLLLDESTSRFSGAEWFNAIQQSRIILAGLGGIGSNVAYQLARMSPKTIVIYDDDVVERANMSGQFYNTNNIGLSKVDAVCGMLLSYAPNTKVFAIKEKFTPDTEAGDIMICGFDNMRARNDFYCSWVKHLEGKSTEEKAKCLFIDGRLSINDIQILCIRGDDEYNIARYRKEFIFSDAQAEPTVCSMKQTTYLACMIGSLIVNLFTNFIANTLNPVLPYDLPFFTTYDAQNMLFKTEY